MQNYKNKYKMDRNEYFKFRVSKSEKELIQKYTQNIGINASRFVRNIILKQVIKGL